MKLEHFEPTNVSFSNRRLLLIEFLSKKITLFDLFNYPLSVNFDFGLTGGLREGKIQD